MNLIGFQAYGQQANANLGARTGACRPCEERRVAHTGASKWLDVAHIKKAMTPQFKLWPTIKAPHTGAASVTPTPMGEPQSMSTTVNDVLAIAVGSAASGAAGYFIGGGTKSNWIPVLGGSLIGAMSRVGLIVGGILGYAGAHWARR